MGTLLAKHFFQSYFNTFKRLILHKNYTREHEPMSQGAVVVLRQVRNVITWRKHVTFHEVMVIMSALYYTGVLSRIQTVLKRSLLRQQSAGGHVAQLGHNILTSTTSICVYSFILRAQGRNKLFIRILSSLARADHGLIHDLMNALDQRQAR